MLGTGRWLNMRKRIKRWGWGDVELGRRVGSVGREVRVGIGVVHGGMMID